MASLSIFRDILITFSRNLEYLGYQIISPPKVELNVNIPQD